MASRKFSASPQFIFLRTHFWFGGEEEDRTPDLRIANATLSQLSYFPTLNISVVENRITAKVFKNYLIKSISYNNIEK
jgi:hypothetical protein